MFRAQYEAEGAVSNCHLHCVSGCGVIDCTVSVAAGLCCLLGNSWVCMVVCWTCALCSTSCVLSTAMTACMACWSILHLNHS
jgi:hypothetical protein